MMVISTAESAVSNEIIQNSGLLHPQDYFILRITSLPPGERGRWGGGVGGGMEWISTCLTRSNICEFGFKGDYSIIQG